MGTQNQWFVTGDLCAQNRNGNDPFFDGYMIKYTGNDSYSLYKGSWESDNPPTFVDLRAAQAIANSQRKWGAMIAGAEWYSLGETDKEAYKVKKEPLGAKTPKPEPYRRYRCKWELIGKYDHMQKAKDAAKADYAPTAGMIDFDSRWRPAT